jgi:hypothetical protein
LAAAWLHVAAIANENSVHRLRQRIPMKPIQMPANGPQNLPNDLPLQAVLVIKGTVRIAQALDHLHRGRLLLVDSQEVFSQPEFDGNPALVDCQQRLGACHFAVEEQIEAVNGVLADIEASLDVST